MDDILKQNNGKPWLTDENKTVPKKCPKCGADMGLFLEGEPVFLCKGDERHYYGTLQFLRRKDGGRMTREEAKCIIQDMLDDAEKYGDIDYDNLNDFISACKVAIEALKAQTWIPCSERLPEYNESVLTWDGVCFNVEKLIPYVCDDEGEHIFGDWWVSDDYDEFESDYYPNLRDGAAVAWMPLPSPYEEKES